MRQQQARLRVFAQIMHRIAAAQTLTEHHKRRA
jgi:hypothetical protein